MVLRVGEPPRALEDPRGPPLCVIDDFPYKSGRFKLEPNEILLLTTDGVTEAADREFNMYGRARLVQCLSGIDEARTARHVCEKLYADVKRFTRDAAPSDDITIMAVRFIALPVDN
jgi:serine phosphatase RsbU (regulator of sigma subunit)